MPNYSIIANHVNLTYRMFHATSIKNRFLRAKTIKTSKIEFYQALKDVSFTVLEGVNVGLIGSNGAGKSTLLKTLAGIYQPDSGEIKLATESIALLTLGTGFEGELSGLENIFLNGALLGFSKTKINEKLEDIIAFADIGDFIYHPVRTYSSGMKARLSFSIASSIEPDILLIDEMLGVGDENFKEKSKSRLKEIISSNRTVVLAAHNMSTIRDYCDQTIWLEKGSLIRSGKTSEVVDEYLDYTKKNKK
jgi:teichoic acid transport system ATP-binding protein